MQLERKKKLETTHAIIVVLVPQLFLLYPSQIYEGWVRKKLESLNVGAQERRSSRTQKRKNTEARKHKIEERSQPWLLLYYLLLLIKSLLGHFVDQTTKNANILDEITPPPKRTFWENLFWTPKTNEDKTEKRSELLLF